MPIINTVLQSSLYISGAVLGVCAAAYGDDVPGRVAAAMGAGAVLLAVTPSFLSWQNRCMRKADELVAIGIKQSAEKFALDLNRLNEAHAEKLAAISTELGRCLERFEAADEKINRMTNHLRRGKSARVNQSEDQSKIVLPPAVPVTDAVSTIRVPLPDMPTHG